MKEQFANLNKNGKKMGKKWGKNAKNGIGSNL
jgi:hypothetical protein